MYNLFFLYIERKMARLNSKQITAICKLQPCLYGTRNTASQLNLCSKKDFCTIHLYSFTPLVCRAVFLWIQNENVSKWMTQWVAQTLPQTSTEAIWDPCIFPVYSNELSAGQGSDSVAACNFLQHNRSPALPFLCLFCCLRPQTDNWLVLISWASFPDDSSARFGSLALWGNAFFSHFLTLLLGDAFQGGRSCLGLEAQNSCPW